MSSPLGSRCWQEDLGCLSRSLTELWRVSRACLWLCSGRGLFRLEETKGIAPNDRFGLMAFLWLKAFYECQQVRVRTVQPHFLAQTEAGLLYVAYRGMCQSRDFLGIHVQLQIGAKPFFGRR